MEGQMEKGGENIKGLDKERGGCGRMRIARAGVVMAGLMVISGLMATPARGQAVVERREGLSRADLFELGLYTPPKATPSRCQPRIDEARMQEVAKGIQKAFFLEGKESERIARRWLLNPSFSIFLMTGIKPMAFESGEGTGILSGCGPLCGGYGCCPPDLTCQMPPCCLCGISVCCVFKQGTCDPPCEVGCCLYKECSDGTVTDPKCYSF